MQFPVGMSFGRRGRAGASAAATRNTRLLARWVIVIVARPTVCRCVSCSRVPRGVSNNSFPPAAAGRVARESNYVFRRTKRKSYVWRARPPSPTPALPRPIELFAAIGSTPALRYSDKRLLSVTFGRRGARRVRALQYEISYFFSSILFAFRPCATARLEIRNRLSNACISRWNVVITLFTHLPRSCTVESHVVPFAELELTYSGGEDDKYRDSVDPQRLCPHLLVYLFTYEQTLRYSLLWVQLKFQQKHEDKKTKNHDYVNRIFNLDIPK